MDNLNTTRRYVISNRFLAVALFLAAFTAIAVNCFDRTWMSVRTEAYAADAPDACHLDPDRTGHPLDGQRPPSSLEARCISRKHWHPRPHPALPVGA